MNLETVLDKAQERLHDDGVLWPRTDLLRWANEGYRQLLAQSHACVRPFQIDVPGRTAWSATQNWEDRHGKGTFAKFTKSARNGTIEATFRWEVEMLEGQVPNNSDDAVTQLWERAFSGEIDRHFRFAVGKAHERPIRIYWDDQRLLALSARELDLLDTTWQNESGEPIYWFTGVGREKSYEVFSVVTSYNQQYDLKDADEGVPRQFTGTRTYGIAGGVDDWDFAYSGGPTDGATGLGFRFTRQASDADQTFATFIWEEEFLESETTFTDSGTIFTHAWESEFGGAQVFLGLGEVRGILSDDRQYLPAAYDAGDQLLGSARDFKGSADSLTIWEIIVPTRQLTEEDEPELIPIQLHKFLAYYVLSRAFAKTGEGQRPDLAQHYTSLYQMGTALLSGLGNPALFDRVMGREMVEVERVFTPPRVRFPSNFPAVQR